MKKYIIAASLILTTAQCYSMQITGLKAHKLGQTIHKVNPAGGLHIQQRNASWAFCLIHPIQNLILQETLGYVEDCNKEYSKNVSELNSLLATSSRPNEKTIIDEALKSLYSTAFHIHKNLQLSDESKEETAIFTHFPQQSAKLYLEFYDKKIFLKSPVGSIYLGNHPKLNSQILKTITERLVSYDPQFNEQGYYWELKEKQGDSQLDLTSNGRGLTPVIIEGSTYKYQKRIGYGLKLSRMPASYNNVLDLTNPEIQKKLTDVQDLSKNEMIRAHNIFFESIDYRRLGKKNWKLALKIIHYNKKSYDLCSEEILLCCCNYDFDNPEKIKFLAAQLNITDENRKYLIGLE